MKTSELRTMSLEDLRAELAEQERAYFNLRFRKAAGEDIGSAELKRARRDVARFKTLITEKHASSPVKQVPQEKS